MLRFARKQELGDAVKVALLASGREIKALGGFYVCSLHINSLLLYRQHMSCLIFSYLWFLILKPSEASIFCMQPMNTNTTLVFILLVYLSP